MSGENLKVEWIDRGFEPHCPPNPAFPNGIDLDISKGRLNTCETSLPYPAKRIGYFFVRCVACGLTCAVTTAGRVDDPRSLKVACKLRREG